jgi:CRISPR-associated protein (TIGR03986 family)
MIKAPFNFVPLSDKVYFPDWADKISHDVPFEDGLSGTIELKITAQTPIFVRNGHTKEDAEAKNDKYKSFSKSPDGKYFIPATSIKGAIRSVMEIMSFGKLSQVENSSFGLRDLNNPSYRNNMKNICCGWLQQTDNGYELFDWGEPGRISVEAIDKKFKTRLAEFVKGNNFKDEENKTAKYKYILSNAKDGLKSAFFVKDQELQEAKLKKNNIEPRKFYKFGEQNGKEGILVFTGQPSQRKQVFDKRTKKQKWTGKYYEFVFLKPDKEKSFVLSDSQINAFKTIHAESPDYKEFWAKKLLHGERIPVFFKKNGDKIHSIGLAYMYKYPFEKSVLDAIPQEHKKEDLDLCECVFGYPKKDNALRGRVHFGHAFSVDLQTPMTEKVFVSATPHPSYYPLYVKDGRDWNNASRISGRKRYPTREQDNYNNEGTGNMEQKAAMLNKGAIFKERILFHNLKPIELGCLLSAITFHGDNNCFHNLGFGKAFGFGKVKISDLKLNLGEGTPNDYMLQFEKEMGAFLKNERSERNNNHFAALSSLGSEENRWLGSMQLKELFAMAAGIKKGENTRFSYLKMSTTPSENEFKMVKDNKEHLEAFTKVVNREYNVRSIKDLDPITPQENEEKTPEKVVVFETPATLQLGDVVLAKCVKPKFVEIEGCNYEIQLVVPKGDKPEKYVGQSVNVEIAQISKIGKICQVKLIK